MSSKIILFLFLVQQSLCAQESLNSAILEGAAVRFELKNGLIFSDQIKALWKEWIGENQFVGLAEVHRTTQLSYFTTALLPVLKEKGFQNFALELGPNSAGILNEFKFMPGEMGSHIKSMNNRYGKYHISKTPLIFVNKKAHAFFMDKASDLGYDFWGLDQEYGFAYEMLIDRIYALLDDPGKEMGVKYQRAKKALRKHIFKSRKAGLPIDCWYQQNVDINGFMDAIDGLNPNADQIMEDMRTSWDIYCKTTSGQNGNQLRADYMKKNFDNYLDENKDSKVFLKFGSAHLTHDISPFGIDDLGKHLDKKAKENNTGFLSIYQIIAYRNGKSMINDAGWKHLGMFMELGRKDQWTAVDLRPIREKLIRGVIRTDDTYAYKIMNYDIVLVTPDDSHDKPNY